MSEKTWQSPEIETSFAKYLSTAELLVRYNAAVKRLLAEKSILAWIMKSCLVEYKNSSIEQIMEEYIEGEPEIGITPVHRGETFKKSVIEGIGT